MLYIKLWLQAFRLIYNREGFRSACFLMVYARHERATYELIQLINILKDMNEE